MQLAPLDLVIVAVYLVGVIVVGAWFSKRATRGLDAYYLADRGISWWMLGLSGCSSYIDISGTMSMIGLMYHTGLKSVWLTHVFWGWLIICGYMAFQAKWIRRSGVMTFAEWNLTRFGPGRATEAARLLAAAFLLVLMVCNLVFIAVGTGKFAEEFLPGPRWQSTLVMFGSVGIYTTFGGFFGVIYTDILQTVLIAVGAVILAVMAFTGVDATAVAAAQPPGWSELTPSWTLWDGFAQRAGPGYAQFQALGPLLIGGSVWLIPRVLAGPNVWDFQFFLTARSPRDAHLGAGVWTVGYTLRWIIACAFLVLGIQLFGASAGTDAEKIMPRVLLTMGTGMRGLFVAILLAAFMSTINAMINVTSSVVVNDFLKRYARRIPERVLVRCGQLACVAVLGLSFWFSQAFDDVTQAWQTMVFVVVTMILVPAMFRWHWWRFSAWAFVSAMGASALWILVQKALWPGWPDWQSLPVNVGGSLVLSLLAGAWFAPPPMDVLVQFYVNVRPFGRWAPVRREAVARGLVPARDHTAALDVLNLFLTAGLQIALCLVPFCAFLGQAQEAWLAAGVAVVLGIVLWFTWWPRGDAFRPPAAPPPGA